MNAKEAKEIVLYHDNKSKGIICSIPASSLGDYYEAKGYLEALEGEEVKVMVEVLEKIEEVECECYSSDCCCVCLLNAQEIAKEALAKYHKAVKKP